MVSRLILILGMCCTVILPACPSSDPDTKMDVGGSLWDDIEAKEIREYTPTEKRFCVGEIRLEQFGEYDYQCQAAIGKGECIQMPNPKLGNAFYCSLCGLKGSNMVCYKISPEDNPYQ